MNNAFSQMAFNFGGDPPPPPPHKVEEGGYAVGQENGYAGVRVRIKSLKTTKKEEPDLTAPPPVTNRTPLKDTKQVPPPIIKQETAKVIELKLFDDPPAKIEAAAAASVEAVILVVEHPEIETIIAPIEAEPIPDSPSIAATPAAETFDTTAMITEAPQAAPNTVIEETPVSGISVIKPSIPNTPVTESPVADPSAIGRGTKSTAKPSKSKRGRKSLKQVAAEADLIEIPGDDILFSKQYYTMRAVAEMFRVNQSLLRFWETEFDILQPRKNKKGDRYFRPIDIKNLHLIYHLLRQRKYTIEGAKEFLKTNKKAEERFEAIQKMQEIRAFLLEWKAQL